MLERLSELRKKQKWSLQETADHLGIAKSTYAGYESGYREPSLQSLVQIADLFDTSVDYLLKRSDTLHNPIEMTSLFSDPKQKFSIDGELLSADEILDFVAFVRAKRQLRKKRSDQ